MQFFVTVSLYDSNSMDEVMGKVQTRHGYCNLYVTVSWWRQVRAGAVKFPKSWLGTIPLRQKIHHFFFSHTWGTRFRYLPEGCPYMLIYSALHIMQWFSHILDVFTLKIRWKFFDFNISKTNVAYTRLEVIAKQRSALQVEFITGVKLILLLCTILLLPPLSSSSKHGRWQSSLLFYSISM